MPDPLSIPLVAREPTTFATCLDQRELLSLIEAARAISREVAFEKLVGTLLQVALDQGSAQKALLILDRDGDLRVEAAATRDERGTAARLLGSLPAKPALLPTTVIEHVRATQQQLVLDDPAGGTTTFHADPYFLRCQPRSVLCLPILRQHDLMGELYLENEVAPAAFTPARLAALAVVAAQAAISLDNSSLLNREHAARGAAEAAERRARFLAETGAILSQSLDYEETLSQVVRLCIHESLAENCLLDVVEGRHIRRLASASTDPVREENLQRLARCYPARWGSPHPASICMRTGKPLLAPDMDDAFIRKHTENEEHYRIVKAIEARSAMVVPLITHGQAFGALTMGASIPRRFGQADLELALDVGRRAAVAIENARLHGEVQQADQRKSEFISVLSHELRNPLAPIRTGLQLLRRALPGEPVVSRALEIMARQVDHLTHLVEDLLDVTRVSRGKIELHRARVDVREVVGQTCDDLRSLFEDGALGFHLELPSHPLWVDVDPTRVSQVVGNLLQNAVKFTPMGGSVTVEVALGRGCAVLSVRDTGIGMRPGEVDRMFEPFAQAEQGLARTQGGLGLGLTLAKGLVELHGGSIRARSEGPGCGSEFVVTVPLSDSGKM